MEGRNNLLLHFQESGAFWSKTQALLRGVLPWAMNSEYADEVTLGRSITNRVPFDSMLKNN